MPTYVQCKLTISGPASAVDRFCEANKNDNGELTLAKAVPEPPNAADMGCEELCEWREKNWGTDRDVCGDIEIDDNFSLGRSEYIVRFNSVKWPPRAWTLTVATQNPALRLVLEYDDGGFAGLQAAGAGRLVIMDGVVAVDDAACYTDAEDASDDAAAGSSQLQNMFQIVKRVCPEATSCPICLEEMDTDFTATDCGHLFHQRCLEQCPGEKCPMCRAALPPTPRPAGSAGPLGLYRLCFDE